jgi:hypothetical protein
MCTKDRRAVLALQSCLNLAGPGKVGRVARFTLGGPRSATAATALWQREFFDHVLRSDESYSEKWNYVFDNPVRAGLVSTTQEWKYAGEIETLML